jgi:hypothetical protein
MLTLTTQMTSHDHTSHECDSHAIVPVPQGMCIQYRQLPLLRVSNGYGVTDTKSATTIRGKQRIYIVKHA